jgi:hypothetical protein
VNGPGAPANLVVRKGSHCIAVSKKTPLGRPRFVGLANTENSRFRLRAPRVRFIGLAILATGGQLSKM